MTREEAINEIKSWDFLNEKESEAVRTLIPELRESEDERIRKALIDALKVSETIGELKFRLPYPTKEECIAYLKKQKEQKPISFNEPYNPDEYEVVMEGNATSLKRKEQKSAEWSEEDEVLRQDCIRFIETGWTDNGKSHLIPWLKSLRPQPHWKPSEEQMDALKELIDDANRAGWVTPGATELYEQLKKL